VIAGADYGSWIIRRRRAAAAAFARSARRVNGRGARPSGWRGSLRLQARRPKSGHSFRQARAAGHSAGKLTGRRPKAVDYGWVRRRSRAGVPRHTSFLRTVMTVPIREGGPPFDWW